MSIQKREAYFDNIKCVLIFLVVIGHFIDFTVDNSDAMKSIFLFIYSFHMPLFIFLSGLFCKNTIADGRKTAVRVVFFFILYVLMKLLTFLVNVAFDQEASFQLFTEGGAPWYLFAMAVFYATGYAVKNVNRKALLVFSVLVAVLAGCDSAIGDEFVLLRIFVFMPFFIAGWYIDREKLQQFMSQKLVRMVGAVCCIVFAIACVVLVDYVYEARFLFSGRHNYAAFQQFAPYGPILRLVGYVVSGVMCFVVMAVIPQKRIPVVSVIGQRTLGIYFFHRPILSVLIYSGALESVYSIFGVEVGIWIWILMAVVLTLILALPIFNKAVNFEKRLYI